MQLLARQNLGMTLYIVRHALAVPRRKWDGLDDDRPLTQTGRTQTKQLLKWSHHIEAARVLTSPTTRCIDTVRRVASAFDVTLELTEALRLEHEDEAIELARALVESSTDAVICTHGEIIKPIMRALHPRTRGGDLDDCAKGSVWALRPEKSALIARYATNQRLPTTRSTAAKNK